MGKMDGNLNFPFNILPLALLSTQNVTFPSISDKHVTLAGTNVSATQFVCMSAKCVVLEAARNTQWHSNVLLLSISYEKLKEFQLFIFLKQNDIIP